MGTDAARGSSGGQKKYLAYCKATGKTPDVDTTCAVRCHIGIGVTESTGVTNISFPMGAL